MLAAGNTLQMTPSPNGNELMNHNDDPRITAYLFDELGPDKLKEFELELESSAQLRELVESTRATIEQLRIESATEGEMALSGPQREKVLSGISSRPGDTSPGSGKSAAVFSRRPTRAFAIAGGIAALISVAALQWGLFADLRLAEIQRQQDVQQTRLQDRLEATPAEVREKYRTIDQKHWTEGRIEQLSKNDNERVKVELVNRHLGTSVDADLTKRLGQRFEDQSITIWTDHGAGPGMSGDKFDPIVDNAFRRVTEDPLSTFSIDVDTASYSKVRMFLRDYDSLPRPDAVRIEELVNYFTYDYAGPTGPHPFSANLAAATCPWNPKHQLVRIGIKGREIPKQERPRSNLVFLLDVSGSMKHSNKLPLVKTGMKMLVDQLSENDQVAIVVYAGASGLVLDSTTADQKGKIIDALDRLHAGGSTNGGEGIRLAYATAIDHFIEGGVNRVILCTDGDFNVGTTGTDQLVRVVADHAKDDVFLSVLGFGMGNHNDAMLEQISNKGNGNYAMVDSVGEARKVLVQQTSSTLVTIAKDVKIQVEFNPKKITAYRLIGYENRILHAQDFNDDTKDAGEIGAGHTVTALYEIVPSDKQLDVSIPTIDPLKYQTSGQPSEAANQDELLTLKLRYKQPDEDTSTLMSLPLEGVVSSFNQADRDFQFAAAVASFGMLLRDSKYKGNATYSSVLEIAASAAEDDGDGYRTEFLELIRSAARLTGESLP